MSPCRSNSLWRYNVISGCILMISDYSFCKIAYFIFLKILISGIVTIITKSFPFIVSLLNTVVQCCNFFFSFRKAHECSELEGQLSTLEQSYQESQSEMEVCRQRQNEMLQLTQKMTERSTELQSENSALKSKVRFYWFAGELMRQMNTKQYDNSNNLLHHWG